MVASRFAETQPTVPRSTLLAPMAAGLVMAQQQIWDWAWCGPTEHTCAKVVDALTWLIVIFPHALAFPLAMTTSSTWVVGAILVGFDMLICLAVWRTQPARLSLLRFISIVGTWVVLSAASTWVAPDLAVWAYHAAH